MHSLTPLFDGGITRHVPRGQALFFQGDDVAVMAQVVSGVVVLHRPLPNGGTLVLQRAIMGDVLAEASAYTPLYHCAAVAETDAVLTQVPLATFRARLAGDMAAAWAAHLAHAVQNARMRAEIRSLRGVAARLEAWLATGRALPPHGQLQDLAGEIGVTREALYRELAKRRG